MTNKQYIFIIVLALIGGILGGFLSGKIFTDSKAFALDKSKRKIISANEFRVVDDKGNVVGSFGVESNNVIISIRKKDDWIILSHYGLIAHGKDGKKRVRSFFSADGFIYDQAIKGDKGVSTIIFKGLGNHDILIGNSGSNDPPILEFNDILHNRISIGIDKSKEPFIALRDSSGDRAVLGHIELTDKANSTIIRHESSLVLFNKNGHVIWSAP